MMLQISIAEVAKMVGVSAATIRAWERAGLVNPPRSKTGYRRFSSLDVERLRHIRRLRGEAKLSLQAIHQTVGSQPSAEDAAQCSSQADTRWVDRLKTLRKEHGLSLRQLSAQTGLSPSFISLIERGLANPSIAALQKLTTAYGTSIVELMDPSPGTTRKLVRPANRRVYNFTPGVSLEQLNFGDHQMELHLFTVGPGAGSSESYQHAGEEFIFMMEGVLEVWLDKIERYVLEPGDVLYFQSMQPHQWVNIGESQAVFLGVNTPATF